jgi:hypothetical protein
MERAAWAAVGALAGLFAVLVWAPWLPLLPDAGLDSSWSYALHLARVARWRWGEDVVFSYGPTGYVFTGMYHPDTYAEMIAAWTFVALVAATTGTWLARRHGLPPGVALLWLVALFAVAGLSREPLIGLFPLLLLAAQAGGLPSLPVWRRWLLVLAVAGIGLVKFTTFVATAAVVLAVAVDQVAARRRLPIVLLEWGIAVLATWLVLQGSLANVGAYLTTSWEISAGYAEAMWSDGPAWETVAGGVVAALVLGLASWTELRARGPAGLAWVLGVAVLLGMAFRGGFVRHDAAHARRAALAFLLTALVLLPSWWRSGRRARGVAVAVLVVAAAFASVVLSRYLGRGLAGQLARVASDVPAFAAGAGRVLGGTAGLDARMELHLRFQRQARPVPPVAEPTDVAPVEVTVLSAHGLEYAPRPVFQSYAAYTPRLAELNAARLREPRAPAGVLLRLGPTDDHHPMSEDGPWWLEVLSRYRISGFAGAYLAWDRVPGATGPAPVPLATLSGRLGERLALPPTDGAPIRAVVDVGPSLLGRLALVAFKSPGLVLDVETADGGARTYRLVPGAARAGFLLSPLLVSTLDVAALVTEGEPAGALAGRDVVAIRVRALAGGGAFHRPEVVVRLSRVAVPRRRLPDDDPQLRVLAGRLALVAAARAAGRSGDDVIVRPLGEEVVRAHPPSRLDLRCPPGGTHVLLRFGVDETAWRSGPTDGVEFAAIGIGADGREAPLWWRTLDPAANPADRGLQRARAVVTPGTVAVRLETRPRGTPDRDWAYWADAVFE